MSDDDDPERTEGVDFTDLNPVLEDVSYPITADEFVERYGDRTLGRTNADPITVEELFDYMGDTSFDDDDELRQQIIGQMPRETTGRAGYSDRGGSLPEETEEAEKAEKAAEETDGDYEEGTAADPDTKQQE